jgi:hypothetical protein
MIAEMDGQEVAPYAATTPDPITVQTRNCRHQPDFRHADAPGLFSGVRLNTAAGLSPANARSAAWGSGAEDHLPLPEPLAHDSIRFLEAAFPDGIPSPHVEHLVDGGGGIFSAGFGVSHLVFCCVAARQTSSQESTGDRREVVLLREDEMWDRSP